MRRKVTDALIDHSVELIQMGKTIIEISSIIGISPDVISKFLRVRGIDTKIGRKIGSIRRSLQIDLQKVKSMYQDGISENQIAKTFKVSRLVVRKHLIRAGVQMRSQSEAEKLKWSQMSPSKRNQQLNAAHIASKGRIVSAMEKAIRARIQETRPIEKNIGIGESVFKQFLSNQGIDFKYQAAVGPYNIDFLIGSVAVEITANTGRFYKNTRLHRRVKDLLKSNIKTLYVLIKDEDLLLRFAQDLITDIQAIDSYETPTRHYWVIKCRRQNTAVIHGEGGKLSSIGIPEEFFYESATRQLS